LNAAAQVVSGMRKFNHGLMQGYYLLVFTGLTCLSSECIKYKLLDDAPVPGGHCCTVSDSTLATTL